MKAIVFKLLLFTYKTVLQRHLSWEPNPPGSVHSNSKCFSVEKRSKTTKGRKEEINVLKSINLLKNVQLSFSEKKIKTR